MRKKFRKKDFENMSHVLVPIHKEKKKILVIVIITDQYFFYLQLMDATCHIFLARN